MNYLKCIFILNLEKDNAPNLSKVPTEILFRCFSPSKGKLIFHYRFKSPIIVKTDSCGHFNGFEKSKLEKRGLVRYLKF